MPAAKTPIEEDEHALTVDLALDPADAGATAGSDAGEPETDGAEPSGSDRPSGPAGEAGDDSEDTSPDDPEAESV